MAKEVVTKCDKCGNPGEDVETYCICLPDGTRVEVDLDREHATTLLELATLGRPLQSGPRRENGNHSSLEARIRGLDG